MSKFGCISWQIFLKISAEVLASKWQMVMKVVTLTSAIKFDDFIWEMVQNRDLEMINNVFTTILH